MIAAATLLLLPVVAACEQERDRVPPIADRPYDTDVPEVDPQAGIQESTGAIAYRIVRADEGGVVLEPMVPAREDVRQPPREQGDPVYQFVLARDRFERIASTDGKPYAPRVGDVVWVLLGPNAQPERITPAR